MAKKTAAKELNGRDFVALTRLSRRDGTTLVAIGETCESVPAAESGGTISDALALLLSHGFIAPVADIPAEKNTEDADE